MYLVLWFSCVFLQDVVIYYCFELNFTGLALPNMISKHMKFALGHQDWIWVADCPNSM